MKKNYKVVKKLLETHKKCRDNDKALIWLFWIKESLVTIHEVGGIKESYLTLDNWKKATPASTIVRARREVQADFPYLRGEKYKKRQKQSVSMKSKNNRYKYYEGSL